MKKIYGLFMGLVAASVAPGLSAQELVIETNHGNEDIEIIGSGRFDIVNHLVGNTNESTVLSLGEVDFADGGKYKAASVDFANGWSAKGWAILRAGADYQSSVPFVAIPLNKFYDTYYIPRHYGENIVAGTSDQITVDEMPLEFVVPQGKQNLYLTFHGCNGNVFGVNLHENAFVDDDFIAESDGDWNTKRLRDPNEDARLENHFVTLSIDNAVPAVPTGADTDFPETRVDGNNGWGWTKDGFAANYGTVDFGDNRFGQVVIELNHWSQNSTDYIEFYLDEVADENKIGSVWTGRELRNTMYNLATSIAPVSGEHALILKWVGGSTNVRNVSLYEGTPWYKAKDCGKIPEMVDELPAEDAFHYTVEGTQNGEGGVWKCEILNKGQFEGNGNVGYTGNGTVIKYTMPDGTGIDFGDNLYESIVVNHACDKAWTDFVNNSNFTFYVDLEDWHDVSTAEPIAIVRLQGTGSWGTRKHVRGDIVKDVTGKHDLYMFINTPTTDAGANVFDIYLEPRPQIPGRPVPSLEILTNHQNMDNIEIIGSGRYDIEHLMISNTNTETIIGLGEVDFADGEKYKAASVNFANGWSTDGWIILKAGADAESAVPFTQIALNEYKSYYLPRQYGANMGFNINGGVSPDVTIDDVPVEYTKPVGRQKVYLQFVGGNGNLFAVDFYETEFSEYDFVKEGQGDWGGDTGIRLLWPSEDPRFEDKSIVIPSTDAVAAVEGFDAHINNDTNAWGWTADGFVADYGTVDFGENRFGQVVAYLQRWDKNSNANIEIYIDEVAESNLVARMWAGREARDKFYPVVGNLSEVSGSHKLLVKWAGSSFDLFSIGLYEGHAWPLTTDYCYPPEAVDELPAEDAFHYTVEGTQNGEGGVWKCEILNKGQFEGNGNVGYTGNGTVIKYTMPDGTGIDFGDNLYESIVVNHACDKAWTDFVNNSNFTFYVDLEDWHDVSTAEPIAIVRLQGTGSWGTRKHVRGDIVKDVTGKHDLYMFINTPTTDAGANVFDIYLEYKPGMSEITDIVAAEGAEVYAEAGAIVVNTEAATDVTVYGVNGVAVVSTTVDGNRSFAVAPGFYVVKIGSAAVKVIVK